MIMNLMFFQPIITFSQSLHECILFEKLIVSPQGAVFDPVYLNQTTILSPFLIPTPPLLFSLPLSLPPSFQMPIPTQNLGYVIIG